MRQSLKKTKIPILRTINTIFLWLFVLNALFIPHDTLFNLKKLSLAIMLVINVGIIFNRITSECKRVAMYGFILSTFAILWSIILTGNIIKNISSGYVGYILLLLPVIEHFEIDFEKIFVLTMRTMAYFIVLMGLLHITGILPVNSNPILSWLYNTENAKINPASVTGLGFAIFLLASPVLLVAMPFLMKIKVADAFIALIALIFSGTRANVICGLVLFIILLVLNQKNHTKRAVLIGALFFIGVFALLKTNAISYFQDWFTKKMSSDAIRTLTLKSIFNYWELYPESIILGTGFSSVFFNLGRGEYVSNAELSYWILLRRVGLPLFIAFLTMFVWPIYKICKNDKTLFFGFGYIMYLIVAYTNPLLYGSTGMTVVLFMYYVAIKSSC